MWPLRSFLFVPAHRPALVAKAARAAPDAVILDLEDSVPPGNQAEALEALPGAIAELGDHGIAAFVRMHRMSEASAEEVARIVHPGLAGVMLPKAASADEVRRLHELLSYHEGRQGMEHGAVAILPLPETAEGLQRAEQIARASRRVKGIAGTVSGPVSGDVAQAVGFRATLGGMEQLYMQSKLILDSRAAGAPFPIACVFGLPLDDLAAVERLLRRARELGFAGCAVMHPTHVALVHEVFRPTAEEAAYYGGMLAAFEEAERAGLGAVRYEGAMVDYAMLPLARQVVEEFHRSRHARSQRPAPADRQD